MWRRKTTGIVALALGILLFIGGLVDHAFAAGRAAVPVRSRELVQGVTDRAQTAG